MITHYVYKIIDNTTGEFYFGSRSCNCNADDDDYMGSMKTWKPIKSNLIKSIIKDDFKTRLEAYEFENKIMKVHITDELNRNYHCNKNFHTYGRVVPEEQKQRQSKKMKGKMAGELHPMYGKTGTFLGRTHTNKTKKLLSNVKSGKNNPMYGKCGKLNPMSKPIIQYNKDHIFIAEWESTSLASKRLNIQGSNITSCCTGKLKSAGGFIWKHKTNI